MRFAMRTWLLCAVTSSLMACGPEPVEKEKDAAAPAVDTQVAAPLQGSVSYSGSIDSPGSRHVFPFSAPWGGRCLFETYLGSLPDSVLWLYGPNNTTNALAYDDDSGDGYASRLMYLLEPGATYFPSVGGFGSYTGTFTLHMSCYASATYRTYVETQGWQDSTYDARLSGTYGQQRGLEALQLNVAGVAGASVRYAVHLINAGWTGESADGQVSGAPGQGHPIEAVRIWLVNAPAGCNINYQTHYSGNALGSGSNGQVAGSIGLGLRVEAVSVWLSGCN